MADTPAKGTEVKVERKQAPARTMTAAPQGMQAFQSFRDEMDRMFDNFFRGFPMIPEFRRVFGMEPYRRFETAFGIAPPVVDVAETDKEFQIMAELPGLDEKDIDISLSGDMLTIRGEKSEGREEKERSYHLSERRYGSFQRAFYLPEGVDRDKIAAKFDKGVLTLTLPKTAEAAKQHKKIPIGK